MPALDGFLLPLRHQEFVRVELLGRAGRTRANNAILGLSADGIGAVVVANHSPGTVHVLVDVTGYFR